MDTTTLALIELGAVFFALGLLGRLAARVGMSPIPFYLIGGLCFGQGGFVLLLLLLGLEYTAAELVTGLKRSRVAGIVDIVLNATPGAVVGLMLGWGVVGATVMAGVTYISSSGIIAKVLSDLGRLGNRETPVVLSILVFEDLAMALYLPILTAMLAGVSFMGGLEAVGISLLVITVVLVVASTVPTVRRSCSSCSVPHCWSPASVRRCRCRRLWAHSSSESRSRGRRRTMPVACSSPFEICSPQCSSWSSVSTPIPVPFRQSSDGPRSWQWSRRSRSW